MNVKYVECCSQNCVCKLNRSSFTVLTLTRIPRILPLNFFFFSKDEKANFFLWKKKFWNYLLLLWHFVTRVTAIMSFFACHTVTLRLFFCDRCDSYNVTLTVVWKRGLPPSRTHRGESSCTYAAPTQKKSMQFGCNSDAIRTSDNSDAIRMDRFGWQVGDLRIFRNEALAENSDEIRMRVVPQFVLLVTTTSTILNIKTR